MPVHPMFIVIHTRLKLILVRAFAAYAQPASFHCDRASTDDYALVEFGITIIVCPAALVAHDVAFIQTQTTEKTVLIRDFRPDKQLYRGICVFSFNEDSTTLPRSFYGRHSQLPTFFRPFLN